MFDELGKPVSIDFIPMPLALKGRYQYFTQASMQKLPAAGYGKSMTRLEDGIRYYVRDFLARPERYR